ncbi:MULTISPECIES: DUF6177 family protein [unclassified Streptomyces]|uniref:DUF6177 family protein n=1 Tax=unclassified Streptomyces TaxID=2593676 RepID=UPI00225751D3|nr:DUF6177 family protein [Streptomyces sp. NBC_01500]MCX4550034.1 DUF6177 family protein [Streptomyces sp. NBC_01500]WSV55496.1 DUF6177 family protein [Streptomyces sp. NBC_01014]
MTKDVIALTPTMPDVWAVLAGLYAGGPGLRVDAAHDGAVIQLRAPDGRPLVSVEAPFLVQVPGEAERLLGPGSAVPDGSYWWTEVRTSTALPEAERLAGSVAGRLAALLGGTTWPPAAATTHVVGAPADGVVPHPVPGGAQPAVDVLTESTAVVLADRPVIALTTWLSGILRATVTTGRALQIVTPPQARLTLPLRTALSGAPNRWVVRDPACGYYDGLSGAVLRWQDGTFAPPRSGSDSDETPVATAFADAAPTGERQLAVSFRILHPADDHLVLGDAVHTVWQDLTGSAPVGWGTAEPINLPWSTRQLTDLARHRAPGPTHVLAVGRPGRPALADHRITRVLGGVAEDITLTLGYGDGETPPIDAITPLAESLVTGHRLVTLLVSLRRARRDLTVPPRFESPPVPLSFTLGATDVSAVGLAHARRPPVDVRPVLLGPSARPALHYPLGDGSDARAWTLLQQLASHLEGAGKV